MRWLNDILIFLHFIGLLLGAAPGIANMVIARQIAKATPEAAAGLRIIPPILANISAVGILLLWVTGIVLVFTGWRGPENLPTMFWVKLVFVVILTIITVMVHMTIREIKRTGNVALGARLPKLGPFAGAAALLSTFFAVLAFH